MSGGPLLLAPLRTEALALRLGARRADIRRIGMGPVRATAARTRLSREPAGRPMLLLGFAGALRGDLRPGELVVATSCAGLEEEEAIPLPAAGSVADLLEAAGLRSRLGPLVSAARILKGREERQRAGARGALVVDMESRWCAPLAGAHPLAVVRAVVDVPGHDVLSASTPLATWQAFRSLAAAAGALQRWSPPERGSGDDDGPARTREENCKVGDR